ncbi:CRISPR-associated endoribonuclease Cas6 [Anaerocolumna xylanovorans]|uniref:CRISPR-associated endoribonuclease n=1 Tax=Anaerocolumna xylanovorans DSM 12503 TaxID=1121345 RepID=A0A1M7YDA0_9FIRM|nr:CRISPR-associated endoribonuclease Cas6 [Anaerocolumna xylanovorans]SHO50556.1 CRISPR-associated endoribonuclease Cas6 [Anaerocolumna xylanovorans DSM 12503]
MRVEIFFDESHPLAIPIQYNHYVQAMIFSWIKDKEYSTFIHDKGYQIADKKYKLFTFSRMNGLYQLDKENGKIIFLKDISLTVSSMSDEFMGYLLNSVLLQHRELHIGDSKAIINRIELKETPIFSDTTFVHTLSPCTVYTTLENKKTRYYSPFEEEYNESVRQNLIHKYTAYYGKVPKDSEFKIVPMGRVKQAKVNYKNFHIIAYDYSMKLEGSEELKRVAYNAGLGAKNSQGFGCIEILNEQGVNR